MVLGRQESIRVGRQATIESRSPAGNGIVFEDDGDTGYAYVVDMSGDEPHILDALHIYDAGAVSDADEEHELAIVWSDDGMHAAVFLNRYAHAMAGFEPPLAMCADDFPPPSDFVESHAWDEAAFNRVFPEMNSQWAWQQEQA
jgi:hypothetical protein